MDSRRAKETTGDDSGEVAKGQMAQGLEGCKRSLHVIPRAVGSLMELQIWLRPGLCFQEAISLVGERHILKQLAIIQCNLGYMEVYTQMGNDRVWRLDDLTDEI